MLLLFYGRWEAHCNFPLEYHTGKQDALFWKHEGSNERQRIFKKGKWQKYETCHARNPRGFPVDNDASLIIPKPSNTRSVPSSVFLDDGGNDDNDSN